DGFEIPASYPDFEIHSQIGADLANAQRLYNALAANHELQARLTELRRTNPLAAAEASNAAGFSVEKIYPTLMTTPYRGEWLLPMVRRFVWNHGQGDAGAPWLKMLGVMINLTIHRVRGVNDPQFLELCELAPVLVACGHRGLLNRMGGWFGDLARRGPLAQEVVAAARRLLPICEDNSEALKAIGMYLFRSEANAADFDTGWSKRIHDDLAAMKKKDRALWIRTLTGGMTYSRTSAIARLGHTAIEARLRRWVEWLRQEKDVELSPVGALLFPDFLNLCEQIGGPACDEVLYEIARVNWKRIRIPYWIHQYLEITSRRPQDRAFACLEAMAMNPVTSDRFVRRQYDAVAATMAAREAPAGPVGVDGYRLDRDLPIQRHQERIDQLLRIGVEAVAKGPWYPPNHPSSGRDESDPYFPVAPEVRITFHEMATRIMQEFAADLPQLHRAATRRSEWISAHKQEFPADWLKVWWELLHGLGCEGGLVQRSLGGVKETNSLDDMLRTIRSGGREQTVELCRKYVAEHGWTPELVETFRKFIPSFGNALSDQVQRARAEWFVWFEDVCPIDLNACWSHRVKRDLRAMTAEERAAWRAILENNSFRFSGKPPQTWMKAAEELFPCMDREVFRRRFVAWFEPFTQPEPLRLTVTGRNILRVLMWYALMAEDSIVDQALAGFAKAKWKTKDAASKASQAEMAFSCVLARRAPEVALPILEEYVASGRAFEGSETHQAYLELCRVHNRQPAPALPETGKWASKPQPQSANPPVPVKPVTPV
ncbi:MAG TPA: hypothetical protein VGF59_00915, partial [Bryobacteraceae bacterium]